MYDKYFYFGTSFDFLLDNFDLLHNPKIET